MLSFVLFKNVLSNILVRPHNFLHILQANKSCLIVPLTRVIPPPCFPLNPLLSARFSGPLPVAVPYNTNLNHAQASRLDQFCNISEAEQSFGPSGVRALP